MEDRYEIVQWKTTSMYAVRPKSGGRPPKELSGAYTKRSVAEAAIQAYQKIRDKYKPETSPLIELEKLSKKDHLLEFAEICSIEVPESMKQPATIKKFIKEHLEE